MQHVHAAAGIVDGRVDVDTGVERGYADTEQGVQQDQGEQPGRKGNPDQTGQHQQAAAQHVIARAQQAGQSAAVNAGHNASRQQGARDETQGFQRYLKTSLHLYPGDAQRGVRYPYGDEPEKADGKELPGRAGHFHEPCATVRDGAARLASAHLLHWDRFDRRGGETAWPKTAFAMR